MIHKGHIPQRKPASFLVPQTTSGLLSVGIPSAPGPDVENLHWVQESPGLRSQSADSEPGFQATMKGAGTNSTAKAPCELGSVTSPAQF